MRIRMEKWKFEMGHFIKEKILLLNLVSKKKFKIYIKIRIEEFMKIKIEKLKLFIKIRIEGLKYKSH